MKDKTLSPALQLFNKNVRQFSELEGSEVFLPMFNAFLEICSESMNNPAKVWSANLFFNLMSDDDGLSGYISERTEVDSCNFKFTFGKFAERKPRKVMTVPDAVNSAVPASTVFPAMVTDAVEPRASAICEATVRFQIRS